MRVVADVCVVPIGVGVSLSRYIAACKRIFEEAGFSPLLHAHGTNIEGDWDEVLAAVKGCHEEVHRLGAARITTTVKLATRIDRPQTGQEKIESVERILRSQTALPDPHKSRVE